MFLILIEIEIEVENRMRRKRVNRFKPLNSLSRICKMRRKKKKNIKGFDFTLKLIEWPDIEWPFGRHWLALIMVFMHVCRFCEFFAKSITIHRTYIVLVLRTELLSMWWSIQKVSFAIRSSILMKLRQIRSSMLITCVDICLFAKFGNEHRAFDAIWRE